MAIVTDKSGANPTYGSFMTHTRTTVAASLAALVPAFVGEVVLLTDTNARVKAWGIAAGQWLALTNTHGFI